MHHHLVKVAKRTRDGADRDRDGRGARGAPSLPAHRPTAPTRSTRISPSRHYGKLAATACSDAGDDQPGELETGENREHPAIGLDDEVFDPVTKEDHEWAARLPQGHYQRHAQGDGEDGHLDAAVVTKARRSVEALGLRDEVIDRCFAGTASRVQGVDFDVLAEEALRRHALGYPEPGGIAWPCLPNPGEFHWRAEGERHMWDPHGDRRHSSRCPHRRSPTRIERFAKH